MSFVTLLRKAQKNEQDAMEQLLMMYQPLLMKEAIVNTPTAWMGSGC